MPVSNAALYRLLETLRADLDDAGRAAVEEAMNFPQSASTAARGVPRRDHGGGTLFGRANGVPIEVFGSVR